MRRAVLTVLLVALWGCRQPPARAPASASVDTYFERALAHEMTHPLAARLYLRVVEHALTAPEEEGALDAVAASLDALVWREVASLGRTEHAVVHRSVAALEHTAKRLRRAYRTGRGTPAMRAMIASTLHELALRVGAIRAAGRWRKRSGCVVRAAAVGPIASPALPALAGPSPVDAHGSLPAALSGVAPFHSEARFDTVVADACGLSPDAVSAQSGMFVLVFDIDNPRAQRLTVSLTSAVASVLDVGGKRVLERPHAAGRWTTRWATVDADAGRIRAVVRVAGRSGRVVVRVVDDAGNPVAQVTPRRGDRAPARVSAVQAIAFGVGSTLAARAAGLLAQGDARQAAELLEANDADRSLTTEVLRLRAIEQAAHRPRNQRRMELAAVAARATATCPACWELSVFDAAAKQDQKGFGTGAYAALRRMGVTGTSAAWRESLGPMELLYVALVARQQHLDDVARAAYDALAARTPNAPMVADLDATLFRRLGQARTHAACSGGTRRTGTACLAAHIERHDLRATQRELARLRNLRGTRAILRDVEVATLLTHDKRDEAMLIWDAMPPSTRALDLLGVFWGASNADAGRKRLEQTLGLSARAPRDIEPLARLLGVSVDRTRDMEEAGRALVVQDRQSAFLPGAGTAVLRRTEHYDLSPSGVLHFWIHDLRRVSGTVDVAAGTRLRLPTIAGNAETRILRRRIHKKDGRVLDTDPRARGAQGDTELSQLTAGDYVEAVVVGWALPTSGGQLTVHTPDLLPPRTSVRDGRVTFRRPRALALKLWSHPLVGKGASVTEGDAVTTTWRLERAANRRLERGVPPLEARAGVSFGTDTLARLGARMRALHLALDERDPFMRQWARKAIGSETDPYRRTAAIVAAAGRALDRPDPGALADFAASGMPTRETARKMIERGVGSRTWVVHRALREVGIASDIVVADARPTSDDPRFPLHTGRFTHPLVRATIDGGHVWIDADVEGPPLPPGRLSPSLVRRKAITTAGTLVSIPVDLSRDTDTIAVDLTLTPNGNARGTCTVAIHGKPAQRIADRLEDIVGSAREALLREIVLSWVPAADVTNAKLKSDGSGWKLLVSANVNIIAFAAPDSDGTLSVGGVLPVHELGAPASTLGARYGKQASRDTALAVSTPLRYRLVRRIALPPKARVVRLPKVPKLHTQSPVWRATRNVSQEGNVVVDRYELNLDVGTITPAKYDWWLGSIGRIDDAFMHTIGLKLP